MNTLQNMNPYDTAATYNSLTVSQMISEGVYKIVQLFERIFRAS